MTTGKFRTRAEYIEAVQLTAENADEVAVWCGGVKVHELDPEGDETQNKVGISFPTLDGGARVSEGDYIIRDRLGRYRRMANGEFQAKYVQF